jgi:thiol-disulfide isomerase/thioredoxin
MLPFTMDVTYVTADSFYIEIINGAERIRCTDIAFGRDRQTGKDTIRLNLPVYGSYIRGRYEEDAIEGAWWDPTRGDDYHIPFRAYHGRINRFDTDPSNKPIDFSGEWKATFRVETETPYPAVLQLRQEGDVATGTILTETGDYRYLAGNVENDRLFLSTFDGTHAYLFEAKFLDDGMLSGTFRSGNHYKTYWAAEKDDTFSLSDPYTLTYLKDGIDHLAFSIPDLDGNVVSLTDSTYAGRPKLVTIFGTWCPNCRDEQDFLSDFFKHYTDSEVAVIAIAFERLKDEKRAKEAIRNYKAHFGIPWKILYGGYSDKATVQRQFPMVDGVISYPTMFFLDAENRVIRIHTGFYGPATDQYQAFVEDFREAIADITTSTNE